MAKIKLLISDIDGTILNEKLECSNRLKELLLKLQNSNIKVVLATGRMYMGAYPVRDELKLNTPVVCYQGAMIRDKNEILYQCPVKNELAQKLITLSRQMHFHLNLYNNDRLIVEDDNKKFMEDYTNGRHTTYSVVKSFDEVKLSNVSKLLAIVYDEDKLLELQDIMQKKFKGVLSVVRSHKYYLEFTDIGATKGNALKFLANHYGIKKEEIMASGDQDNDYDMLENAGIKIAMSNGSLKLKSIADFVAPSVNEDGLYFAIKKYIEV